MTEVRLPASTSNLGPGFDCFGLALLGHAWNRHDRHRDLRALFGESREEPTGTDLEIIRVRAEREHSTTVVLQDAVHAASTRAG